MTISFEELISSAIQQNSAESAERNRLISRKRNPVQIDFSKNYQQETVKKYHHFYDCLTSKAADFGGLSSFGKYLASETGISSGTIQRILNNPDNTKTNVYYIGEICRLLNISLDDAFDLSPTPVVSGFRYDLATYITLMRNAELTDEELLLAQKAPYVHTPLDQRTVCSTDENRGSVYVMSCIDREIGFVKRSMELFIEDGEDNGNITLDKLKLNNMLMPYRFRLVRRDYTNSTSELAQALGVRKEVLSFKRICHHIPRIDIIVTFCLIYGVSLDYLLDTEFAFSYIKDSFTRDLMRRLSVLDYNVCGVIGKIAVLEREGHENLSLGLITSSSVSNKKLKTSFADEMERAQIKES